MLKGLANSFQTDNIKAFRIALSKVSTIDSNELESSLPSSLAQTKLKGHTARNRKVDFRVPKEEKETLKEIAATHKLTEQAAVRLVIIHTAKGMRAGTLTEIAGCKLLSQEECWDNWSKDKPVSSGKLDSLKKARDKGLGKKIDRDNERYKRRGEKIEELISKGEYIPTDLNGEIDITYVEDMIRIDNAEEEQLSWEMYLEELMDDGKTSKQVAIENQIWHAQRIGIDLTEDEAKAIVEEREQEEKLINSEKFELEFEAWFEEHQKESRRFDEQRLAEQLGHDVGRYTKKEIDTLLTEMEQDRKREEERQREKRIHKKRIAGWKSFLRNSKKEIQRMEIYVEELKQMKDEDYKGCTGEDVSGRFTGREAKLEAIERTLTRIERYKKSREEIQTNLTLNNC